MKKLITAFTIGLMTLLVTITASGATTDTTWRTDIVAIWGTDGAGIWGTDGAAIWGTDGAAIWGTDGAAIWGTDGAAIWGTDGAAIWGTDGAAINVPELGRLDLFEDPIVFEAPLFLTSDVKIEIPKLDALNAANSSLLTDLGNIVIEDQKVKVIISITFDNLDTLKSEYTDPFFSLVGLESLKYTYKNKLTPTALESTDYEAVLVLSLLSSELYNLGLVSEGCVDTDDDGVCDVLDNCPGLANASQEDHDEDGFGNACDNCPLDTNEEQADNDEDYSGDVCDDDDDNDGVFDVIDNCQFVENSAQNDFDEDGFGDACDNDNDGDNVLNYQDACPETTMGVVVDEAGCSGAQIIDQACSCDDTWKNHGEFVSCVAHIAAILLEEEYLIEDEKEKIMSERAKKGCGKKQK